MHDLEASDHGPRRLKIGYVGGGSTGWAHRMMGDLAVRPDLEGEVALYDIDHEAAERNARLGNWVSAHEESESDWTYRAYEDRADALSGADAVIISTRDDLRATHGDLLLPEEYGIYQTVWDTVGPGGTIRAMRAIPQYREIAATIREECPDAWVINYTNPMTVCARTLSAEFPDVNAVGLCHEVFGVQSFIAELVGEYTEAEEPPKEEIALDVTGVNHFTWVTGARWRGRDVFGLLDRKLAEMGPLPTFEPGDVADEPHTTNHWNVTMELYRRFGALPAAADRHLVEFVPWFLDVDSREEVHRWGIRPCPTGYREGEIDRYGNPVEGDEKPLAEQYLDGDRDFSFERSGEEAIDIVRALCGLDSLKTNVNMANVGQAPDLARGAVVETNALVTGGEVTPLVAPELPRQVRNMVRTHVANQETLVDAGLAGDLDRAFRAFLNDPLVTVQPDAAADLFREFVEEYRGYLDDWDLAGSAVLDG